MRCANCGNEYDANLDKCPHCGDLNWMAASSIPNQNQQPNQAQNYQQNNYNSGYQNNYPNQNYVQNGIVERVGIGWCILAWFIPLAGLIYFFVKRHEKPKTAKASLITALVAFILNILISCIAIFGSLGIINTVFNGLDSIDANNSYVDYDYDYNEDDNEEISSIGGINIADNEEEEEESQESVSSQKEENNNNSSSNISVNNSSDWKSYTVYLNGKSLKLPCTYAELKEVTGYSMKSASEKSYLEADHYGLENLYNKDGDSVLYVEILNDTSADKLKSECMISSLTQSEYQSENSNDFFIFPGNLKVGQKITIDDIKAIFGEPQDTYHYESDDSDYISDELTYSENSSWTTFNNFEIDIVNGVIDELSLDHRDYK